MLIDTNLQLNIANCCRKVLDFWLKMLLHNKLVRYIAPRLSQEQGFGDLMVGWGVLIILCLKLDVR